MEMFPILRFALQWLGPVASIFCTTYAYATTGTDQSMLAKISADCSAYAAVAIPPDATTSYIPKTFPVCASYRSYRGIGRSADYQQARTCAWQERLAQQVNLGQNEMEPTAWVVGGSLILADIYINGAGVKPNMPLAIHFACESEEGMATLALRDVTKLKVRTLEHPPFEFCDYAATTFTMNFCSGYASEIEDDQRRRYYNLLKVSMTSEQRLAFGKLLEAEAAYVLSHGSEVDQGGTIRTVRTIGSEDILDRLFCTEVKHYENKKWPQLSNNQVATADTLLKQQYHKTLKALQTRKKEETYEGAVTSEHLSVVEKSWEVYRNTWVEFARLRYPEDVSVIIAEVTLRRSALLKTLY